MTNELVTIFIGATPIAEIRGALPVALGVFGFSPLKAYTLSVIGNVLPIIPVFFFFRFISRTLMNTSKTINRLFTKIFNQTRKKYQPKFEFDHHRVKIRPWLEALTLFLFVAIPLPFTGVWTGALVAFVFGVPIRRAFLAMFAGILLAGAVVLGISLGVISFF